MAGERTNITLSKVMQILFAKDVIRCLPVTTPMVDRSLITFKIVDNETGIHGTEGVGDIIGIAILIPANGNTILRKEAGGFLHGSNLLDPVIKNI